VSPAPITGYFFKDSFATNEQPNFLITVRLSKKLECPVPIIADGG